MKSKELLRAQFLLPQILSETRNALQRLPKDRPNIFRESLQPIIFDKKRSKAVAEKLKEVITYFRKPAQVNWDAIEQVGLSGDMLEWKADLFYRTLGKQKPLGTQSAKRGEHQAAPNLTYPEQIPFWGRLLKLLKSLFGSLIEALKEDSKIRMVLDFIKEYIECVEAAMRFMQGGQEPNE